jgi:hypothetical protein
MLAIIHGLCVEYVYTIRDVSSHRPPAGRPAACPQTATGSGRGRMDRIGSATISSPGLPGRTECTWTRIVACPPSSIDGYGGCEPMRFGAITNA